MANQNANIHEIPLQTQELCLNKFDADIVNYTGFNKNNSVFYGDVLSPFYKKNVQVHYNNRYIAPDGTIYFTGDDNNLYMQRKKDSEPKLLLNLENKFVTKEKIKYSGNPNFPTVLCYVDNSDGDMLCWDNNDTAAIVDKNGNLVANALSARPWRVNYRDGQDIKMCVRVKNFGRSDYGYAAVVGNSAMGVNIGNGRNIKGYFVYVDNQGLETLVYKTDYEFHTWNNNVFPTDRKVNCIYIKDENGNTITTYRYDQSQQKAVHICRDGTVTLFDNKALDSSGKYYNFGKVTHLNNLDTGGELTVTLNNNYITSNGIVRPSVNAGDFVCFENPYLGYSILLSDGTTISNTNGHEHIHKPIIRGEQDYRYVPEYTEQLTDRYKPYENNPGYKVIELNSSVKFYLDGVTIDSDGFPIHGHCVDIGEGFRLLYNNGALQGISIAQDYQDKSNGTLLTTFGTVDENSPIYNCGGFLGYRGIDKNFYKISKTNMPSLTIWNDRYIVLNSYAYFNAYDTLKMQPIHFASDYNDRCVFCNRTANSPTTSGAPASNISDFIARYCVPFVRGSGINANYTLLNATSISNLFMTSTGFNCPNIEMMDGYQYSEDDSTGWVALSCNCYGSDYVDLYYSKVEDGVNAKYLATYKGTETYFFYRRSLENTYYPITEEPIYIPSVFAEFKNGFTNQGIIQENNESFMQLYVSSSNPVFGYLLTSALEGITDAFIIQGRPFVIINRVIYQYDSNSGLISAIINIDDMKLIGYTPYQALFWSNTNKTFYSFTGDNTLNPIIQADEIENITANGYNPNTMSIYIVADNKLYLFTDNQLSRLEDQKYIDCFPLRDGLCLTTETEVVYLSYNKIDDYDCLPIILETKFYGNGKSVKSVNDCVYIRLFDNDMKNGKLKLTAKTLNEGTFTSEEKTFNINPSMWDKDSKTLFIRFQPKHQLCTGFLLKLQSDFAIASLQISETPETVQNSKYNI